MFLRDRTDAGTKLAVQLSRYRDCAPLVLGLPRGGVPVACEIARQLHAPLDVWVAERIGAPGRPERWLGAIAEGGEVYLDEPIITQLGLCGPELGVIAARGAAEVERRVRRYRRGLPRPAIRSRAVILVDDGISATETMHAALRSIRRLGPKQLLVASPVFAPGAYDRLRAEADSVVCLRSPSAPQSTSAPYTDVSPITDQDVMAALDRTNGPYSRPSSQSGPISARTLSLEHGKEVLVRAGVALPGELTVPSNATGIVLFAHASSSSRHRPQIRHLAEALRKLGLGTLVFDLLTPDEEAEDCKSSQYRFNISLLTLRLVSATDWLLRLPETRHLTIGYFGASTGATAAFLAAKKRADVVGAIVSCAGRLDLVGPLLDRVKAPSLLLVGGVAPELLFLDQSRAALSCLGATSELDVLQGSVSSLDDPRALEEVTHLSSSWFSRHLPTTLGQTASSA